MPAIVNPAFVIVLRKRSVLVRTIFVSLLESCRMSMALDPEATTLGGRELEKRYGRDLLRRRSISSLEPVAVI